MIKIILIALIILLVLFSWCALKISSNCTRKEEYEEDIKKIRKLWISFWGNRYRVFEDDKLINEILIYHKRIYILGKKGK